MPGPGWMDGGMKEWVDGADDVMVDNEDVVGELLHLQVAGLDQG